MVPKNWKFDEDRRQKLLDWQQVQQQVAHDNWWFILIRYETEAAWWKEMRWFLPQKKLTDFSLCAGHRTLSLFFLHLLLCAS
jgi:hypothetical protein